LQCEHPLLCVYGNDGTGRVKLYGGADADVRGCEVLQVIVKVDTVYKVPGVLPPLVGLRQLVNLPWMAVARLLYEAIHGASAEVLGEDAPSPEDAVGIWSQLNSSSNLIGKPRPFIDLLGLLATDSVAGGRLLT